MKRTSLRITGIVLLVISALGLVQSARAGFSQLLYRSSKFSESSEPLNVTLKHCYMAHRAYPYNYYYCIYAAQKAYGRWQSNGSEKHYGVAEYWCGEAARLNPFNSEMMGLKTSLLEKKSIHAAVENWKIYLDWEFWDPGNHAVMAELYAKSGDFGSAVLSLEWTAGTRYYDPTRKRVLELWDQSRKMPDPETGK